MPNEYQIVKGLEIPESSRPLRDTGRSKIIREMNVGDSVFIENKATASAFRNAMKTHGKQGIVRPVDETEQGGKKGYRVWAVEPTPAEEAPAAPEA